MNARGHWSVFLRLATVGLCFGAGAGCDDGGSGDDAPCLPAPPPQPPKADDYFFDNGSHWILKDESGVCPDVPGWDGRRLFDGSIGGKPIGGKMSRYCAYTWTGAGAPNPTSLPLGLPRAPDPRATTPQTPETVGDWAHRTFLEGIVPPPSAPALKDPRVRVIVADTERWADDPVGSGVVGTNPHGELMALLVGAVACAPGEACAVDVETRVAMPRIRKPGTHADTVLSSRGDFGRLSDLVGAIDGALERWRQEMDGDGSFPEMLALSLSLGFEKAPPGNPPPPFAPEDVVLDALEAFSCHGGVTFAAAGNHGGKDSTGLMYPAAWQDRDEPTDARCAQLLDTGDVDFFATLRSTYGTKTGGKLLRRSYVPPGEKEPAPAKLLHAIGAFDRGGVPIKKTREDACPRYGALGLGWSAPESPDSLLTGTSLSAAVVAAIFAASAAQDTFAGFQNQTLQSPYLDVHPQRVLDELAEMSPSRPFGAEGPCTGEWSCGQIPWIGGPANAPPPQNDGTSFPWTSYYATNVALVPAPRKNNQCTRLPLCEQEATSAVLKIFPMPIDYPCVRGCVVDLGDYMFFINPATDLVDVKLRIEHASGNQIVEITTIEQPVLVSGTQYALLLDSHTVNIPTDARVSVQAFDQSAQTVLSEQVLLVD